MFGNWDADPRIALRGTTLMRSLILLLGPGSPVATLLAEQDRARNDAYLATLRELGRPLVVALAPAGRSTTTPTDEFFDRCGVRSAVKAALSAPPLRAAPFGPRNRWERRGRKGRP